MTSNAGGNDRTAEYLRRNLLHASAVGAFANALVVRRRVLGLKRPPAWLVNALDGIIERVRPLPGEMAAHRDEVAPSAEKRCAQCSDGKTGVACCACGRGFRRVSA